MQEKKKLLIVCPHPVGVAPGQRLKYEQYFEYFEQNGYELDIRPFQTMRFWEIVFKKGFLLEKVFWTLYGYLQRFLLLFQLRNYDTVYIFLWVTPFGPPFFEALYSKISRKMIFDIDDLVFLGKSSANNSWISKIKGKQKPIYLMKHAHHVITCTPYLDKFVRQFNQNTTDISSTINTHTYQPINTYQNDHKIILGWSGSHSTAKYLYLLKDVFIELNRRVPFKLLVMGAQSFEIEGVEVEVVPWSEAAEIPTIQRFDIGLYPLPDEEWVHGKSGLKALQYMAMGVPTVASRIGEAIERVIADGESGFLVRGYKEEWLEKLTLLIENPTMREKIGKMGRKTVVEKYSIDANKDTYLKVIASN
jgi:glycosyltransferase involved in cell wall biosynthesis